MKLNIFKNKPYDLAQNGQPIDRFAIGIMRYCFYLRVGRRKLVISWWYDDWINKFVKWFGNLKS